MEDKILKTKKTGNSAGVLIPVDFSAREDLALRVGFELARRLGQNVRLIHASVIADPMITPQFPDDFNGIDNENAEIEEMELSQEVKELDESQMKELKAKIKKLQADGQLPSLEFETVISPGMPEEVIAEYCAVTPPVVTVMAPRGREKRKEELIGSVTAEVIDHCITPVFTVPEDYTFEGFNEIIRICAFCYLEDCDALAISKLMEMFDHPAVKIFLFPATDKFKGDILKTKMTALQQELKSKFPNSEFLIGTSGQSQNTREAAETLFVNEQIQMILAPNRHRNALARFFNPGLAHKILYEIDFPMLAIPV